MTRLLRLLLLFIAQIPLAATAQADLAVQELQMRSEWWPEKITVKEAITGPLNGREIKPGRQGFVVRLEGEEILADFGRFGVIRLPVDNTNFVEASQELRDDRQWDDIGLWTAQLRTKLMKPKMDGFGPSPISQFEPVNYFILIYLDSQTPEGQAILNWSGRSEAVKELPESQCLALIPADENSQDLHLELLAYQYPGHTLIYPLANPYRSILHHNPGVAAISVIDKNGRQVFPTASISTETDLNALFDELQRRISQDEERRQNIIDAE